MSASSWGCELKYLWTEATEGKYEVSLFVRLWVEMIPPRFTAVSSFVSLFVRLWVEIKSRKEQKPHPGRQPLREAVSWNNSANIIRIYRFRQPLREAVSWNTATFISTDGHYVSLFVRLWVEIIILMLFLKRGIVSLFVRLWVEIPLPRAIEVCTLSASSWGCELKYLRRIKHGKTYCVSLFVRLWVEIFSRQIMNDLLLVSLFVRLWVEIWYVERYIPWECRSASSWGCELKWY